jgi:redox-sensitive bicupin YhaK (pirin superfamily)
MNIDPSYEQNIIPLGARDEKLCLIGSRDGRGRSVTIHQDIDLYSSILTPGHTVKYEIFDGRGVWLQLASGAIEINGVLLKIGDGVAVTDEVLIEIRASVKSEFLLFDLGNIHEFF